MNPTIRIVIPGVRAHTCAPQGKSQGVSPPLTEPKPPMSFNPSANPMARSTPANSQARANSMPSAKTDPPAKSKARATSKARAKSERSADAKPPSQTKSLADLKLDSVDRRKKFLQEQLAVLLNLTGLSPEETAQRVTIWNRIEQRKIAGTAAPLRRNLSKYLKRNPTCDIYIGQDSWSKPHNDGEIDPETGEVVNGVSRVTIWNHRTQSKISGNAAPLPKNLAAYLARNPKMEVYNGQDKLLRQEKAPGIHYPLLKEPIMSNWDAPVRQQPQVHMFPDTHQVVPDKFWPGYYGIKSENPDVASTDSENSTEPSDSACSNQSFSSTEAKEPIQNTQASVPFPISDPYVKVTTCNHGFENLEKMSYEDMASSWSNNPMWTDPKCTHKLELDPLLVTGLQAERSMAYEGNSPGFGREPLFVPIDPAKIDEAVLEVVNDKTLDEMEIDFAVPKDCAVQEPEMAFPFEMEFSGGDYLVEKAAETANVMTE